jgi:dihydrolipoamide dehydrogenase
MCCIKVKYVNNKSSNEKDNHNIDTIIHTIDKFFSLLLYLQLKEKNIVYKKSFFPISALGKAYAEDKIDGFIKILASEDEILGAHVVSEEASALVQQIAIAMANKLAPKELHKVIFAHPTYSEGIGESILDLESLAIHLPKK